MVAKSDFNKISDWLWELPKSFRSDMRVPARVYASEKMLEDQMRIRLVSVEAALERIASDKYGNCMACGGPINPKRLEALPDAALCVDCQEESPPLARLTTSYDITEKTYQGGVTCTMPC